MVSLLPSRTAMLLSALSLLLCLYSNPALANNLDISNAVLASQNTTNDTLTVQFDISWNNSWRDNENYDAVWVFIKYSTDVVLAGETDTATLQWGHAILKTAGTNPSGFSQGSGTGLDIVVSNDKRGFFLQRSQVAASAGTVNTTSIQVLWDYAANGLTDAQVNNLKVPIKIFGIEMVYIPEGGFYIGDGSDGANSGEIEYLGASGSKPCPVNTETAIYFAASTTTEACYYNTDLSGDDMISGAIFNLGESFPKGYQAFYAMKYEITQGQYAEFLNTLSRTMQTARIASTESGGTILNYYVMSGQSLLANSYRNTVQAPSVGNGSLRSISFTATVPWRAMNYLSWMDLAAFADWAALRPMTELEFEKTARGPLYPNITEYAWGNSTTITAAVTFDGDESGGSETITTANANANYNATVLSSGSSGPLRVGILSAGASVSHNPRVYSGGGYYGNMELTGNVWERAVTIGHSAGRNFAGTHGDGALIYDTFNGIYGNATNADWPGISSSLYAGVSGALGSGFRGGAWDTTSLNSLSISNRKEAARTDTTRASNYGGRLVRTAAG